MRTVVGPALEEHWAALQVPQAERHSLLHLMPGVPPQAVQLGAAAVPELPLPECAAPQGSDEDGPEGRPGSKARPPLGWGWWEQKSRGWAKPISEEQPPSGPAS